MTWKPIKTVEIKVTVTVDPSVPDLSVYTQITDAIDPDSWNWEIDTDLMSSVLGQRLENEGSEVNEADLRTQVMEKMQAVLEKAAGREGGEMAAALVEVLKLTVSYRDLQETFLSRKDVVNDILAAIEKGLFAQ
jgi:hypothetical protein